MNEARLDEAADWFDCSKRRRRAGLGRNLAVTLGGEAGLISDMSKRTKRVWLGVGLLLVALAGFTVEEAVRGHFELRAWQRAMRAKGVPLTVAEIAPRPPTNHSVRLLSPSDFAAMLGGLSMPSRVLPPMRMVAPGRTIVCLHLHQWVDDKQQTDTWASVAPVFAVLRPRLAKLRSVLTNHNFVVRLNYTEWGSGMVLPHLGYARPAGTSLGVEAIYAAHEGRYAEALSDLQAGLDLVTVLQSDHILISDLVRIAIASFLEGSTWQVLQGDGWTEAQLAALQATWQRVHYVRPLMKTCAMQRALDTMTCYRHDVSLRRLFGLARGAGLSGNSRWVSNPGGLGELGEMFEPLVELGTSLRMRAFLLWWRVAWREQDELTYDQATQQLIQDYGRLAADRRWRPSTPQNSLAGLFSDRTNSGFHLRHWLSWYLVGNRLVKGNIIREAVHHEVEREMTLTAIALKRYELRYKRLPTKLDELVPQYLPALPRDWYSGRPLRYRLNPKGGFLLYSVGPNGQDDGGDARTDRNEPPDRLSGLDLVWPQPVSEPQLSRKTRP